VEFPFGILNRFKYKNISLWPIPGQALRKVTRATVDFFSSRSGTGRVAEICHRRARISVYTARSTPAISHRRALA